MPQEDVQCTPDGCGEAEWEESLGWSEKTDSSGEPDDDLLDFVGVCVRPSAARRTVVDWFTCSACRHAPFGSAACLLPASQPQPCARVHHEGC